MPYPDGTPTSDDHSEDARRLLVYDGYVDGWPSYEIAKLNALHGIGHALLAIHAEMQIRRAEGAGY